MLKLGAVYYLEKHLMSQPNLTLKISFESLVDTISNLSVEDKQKLWEILDHQLHPSYSELETKAAITLASRQLVNQLNLH